MNLWWFWTLGRYFYSRGKKGLWFFRPNQASYQVATYMFCWVTETIHLYIWIGSPQSIFNHDLIYLARFFYKKHFRIKRFHWLSFCRLYDTVWQQHPSPHNALVFLLHGWLFEGKLLCASVDCMYDTVSFFITSVQFVFNKYHSLFREDALYV